MNYPLVPLPQAGGWIGNFTGLILVMLAILLALGAFMKQNDYPLARACLLVSIVLFISGFVGPLFFGDWAAIVPIGCAFGLGVILLKA